MKQANWDRMGMAVAVGCSVHCLLLPLLLPALPLLGLAWVADPHFENLILLCSAGIAIHSFSRSYRHGRGHLLPILFALLGFAFYLGRFSLGHELELPLLLVGTTLVVSAHATNLMLLRAR